MVQGYSDLLDQADTQEHIIPGHDPIVLDIYPATDTRLTGVIARLDVAPNI